MDHIDNWEQYFIGMADYVSKRSKDRSTRVGAVIVGADNEVLSTGYNGFPRGVQEKGSDAILCRHERPMKYLYTEHAERNAVFNAARHGIRLHGATLYMNYYPLPCADCSRAIIQAGIKKVVGPNIPFPGVGTQWKEHMIESQCMLQEAGVEGYVYEPNSQETQEVSRSG